MLPWLSTLSHRGGLKAQTLLVSHSVVSDFLRPRGLYSSWNSPGQDTGVGILSLLQGIFPTQGSNPGLPHCKRILLPVEPQTLLKGVSKDSCMRKKWKGMRFTLENMTNAVQLIST